MSQRAFRKFIREEVKKALTEKSKLYSRNKDQIEMMEGLVDQRNKKAFTSSTEKIQKDLYDEGFEYDQIDIYLQALLNGDV